MATPVQSQFDVQTFGPLDKRLSKATIAERNAIPFKSPRMRVVVAEVEWVLKARDAGVSTQVWGTLDAHWEVDGSGSGAEGKSAYQSALETGFVGTEAEWVASLEGPEGPPGPDGPPGATTVNSTTNKMYRFDQASDLAGTPDGVGVITKPLSLPDTSPVPVSGSLMWLYADYGTSTRYMIARWISDGTRSFTAKFQQQDAGGNAIVALELDYTTNLNMADIGGGQVSPTAIADLSSTQAPTGEEVWNTLEDYAATIIEATKIEGDDTLIPFFGPDRKLGTFASFRYTLSNGLEAIKGLITDFATARIRITDSITRVTRYSNYLRGKIHATTKGAWLGQQMANLNFGPEVAVNSSSRLAYFGMRQSAGIYRLNLDTREGTNIGAAGGPANGLKLIPEGFPPGTSNFNEISILGVGFVSNLFVYAVLNRQAGGLPYVLWGWNLTTNTGFDVLAGATGTKPPDNATGGANLHVVSPNVYLAHHYGLVTYNRTTNTCKFFSSLAAGDALSGGDPPPAAVCIYVRRIDNKVWCAFQSSGVWVYDLDTNTGKLYNTSGGASSGEQMQNNQAVTITSSPSYVYITLDNGGIYRLGRYNGLGERYTPSSGVTAGVNVPAGWVHAASHYDGKTYFGCVSGGGVWVLEEGTNTGSLITTATPVEGEALMSNFPQGAQITADGLFVPTRGSGFWEYAVGPPEPVSDDQIPQIGFVRGLVDRMIKAAVAGITTTGGGFTEQQVRDTPLTGYDENAISPDSRSATDSILSWAGKVGTALKRFSEYLHLRTEHNITPSVPTAGGVLFAQKRAGRVQPSHVGPSGLHYNLQPSFAQNKVRMQLWQGGGTSVFQLNWTMVEHGTRTTKPYSSASKYLGTSRVGYVAPAAANSIVGQRWTGSGSANPLSGNIGFFYVARFGIGAFSPNMKGAIGVTTIFANTVSSLAIKTGLLPFVGITFDSDEKQWYFQHSGATTGSTVRAAAGAGFPTNTANTDLMELRIFTAPGGTVYGISLENLTTGAVVNYTTTPAHLAGGNIPDPALLMNTQINLSTGPDAESITLDIASQYIETDI